MSNRNRVTPALAADRARSAFRSRLRTWLADPIAAQSDSLSVGLHPPTERQVAVDADAARDWVRTWQGYRGPGVVEWEPRRWPSFGTQDVPVRLRLSGAPEICQAAGAAARWQSLQQRRDTLVALAAAAPFPEAVATTVARWEALSADDFVRLAATVEWLLAHPDSGLLIRQLPIEGVDTKWLGAHRRLVEKLVEAVRGNADLGIRTLPAAHEIAVLDRSMLPGMPSIFAAPVEGLARLPITPSTVLILENREGLYALPEIAGTVAVHDSGYRVTDLDRIGWLAAADIVYWGDLDTHGLLILDRLRRRLPRVRSVLMDPETLERWRHLGVSEPSPSDEDAVALTDLEYDALRQVRAGALRVEQERIPWPYVLDRLAAAGLPVSGGRPAP